MELRNGESGKTPSEVGLREWSMDMEWRFPTSDEEAFQSVDPKTLQKNPYQNQ